jgi:hypothetical protein
MTGHRRQLSGREQAADATHLAQRVIIALRFAPGAKLTGNIGGRLACQRRIGGIAHAVHAVTGGAGREAARGIAGVVDPGTRGISGFD